MSPSCAEGVIEDYWRYVPRAGRAKLKKTPKGKREKTNPFPCPCSPWLLATYCVDFFPSFWRIFTLCRRRLQHTGASVNYS